jgi:hypothetical protein
MGATQNKHIKLKINTNLTKNWGELRCSGHDVITNNTTDNTDADITTGIRKLVADYFGCSEKENKIKY